MHRIKDITDISFDICTISLAFHHALPVFVNGTVNAVYMGHNSQDYNPRQGNAWMTIINYVSIPYV